jgi:hypothetical protein
MCKCDSTKLSDLSKKFFHTKISFIKSTYQKYLTFSYSDNKFHVISVTLLNVPRTHKKNTSQLLL